MKGVACGHTGLSKQGRRQGSQQPKPRRAGRRARRRSGTRLRAPTAPVGGKVLFRPSRVTWSRRTAWSCQVCKRVGELGGWVVRFDSVAWATAGDERGGGRGFTIGRMRPGVQARAVRRGRELVCAAQLQASQQGRAVCWWRGSAAAERQGRRARDDPMRRARQTKRTVTCCSRRNEGAVPEETNLLFQKKRSSRSDLLLQP